MLTVGSLFSGIGGFDLGFDRAGMRTAWFCEQDDFCQRVLDKHWPGVPCYPDIRDLRASGLKPVDVLCGGFPCQDLSVAGDGAGLDGARSGLWSEYARLIGELRPSYVVVENVAILKRRGLGRVLGDMAALGYDAEWDCVPASAVGAPHQRDRIWIVAYPSRRARDLLEASQERQAQVPTRGLRSSEMASPRKSSDFWRNSEPPSPLLVDGFSGGMDHVRAYGNALVPQIAQWIGERIVNRENA